MSGRFPQFFQVAWVVEDIEKAMRHWIDTARVGPFFLIPHVQAENYRYRGTPGTLDFTGALAQAGPMQIELIQQHTDGPSAYRDTFPKGSEGFHHVCSFVDDFDEAVAHFQRQGAEMAHEGVFGDMRFGYIDTRTSIGSMTEIIEDRESIRAIFRTVAEAAVDWDGRDPIRTL